jgi:hypothetical protein
MSYICIGNILKMRDTSQKKQKRGLNVNVRLSKTEAGEIAISK